MEMGEHSEEQRTDQLIVRVLNARFEGHMFTIKLICRGIPKELGPKTATHITEEFWYCSCYANAICLWREDTLQLEATSDFDSDGRALAEEFSEAISACVAEPFDGAISVEQVVRISDL
jgi:hypothetical protein